MIAIHGFEWDEFNLAKLAKHRVSQEEAEEIFYQAPLIDEGAYQQKGEKEYRCLGVTSSGRYLVAFFTIRKAMIRNISVRAMSRKERAVYEKTKSY